MKIFYDRVDLAKELDVNFLDVYYAQEKWIGHGYMYIGDVQIMVNIKEDKFHYVLVDEEDEDCKKYFMTYEIEKYLWKVYVDDIEKWQDCKVIDVEIKEIELTRATVVTKNGTQVNRVAKYVIDGEDEDFKEDGCIYYMDNI